MELLPTIMAQHPSRDHVTNTSMFINHTRLNRGHARSRSRDASLEIERSGSGVSGGPTHHHTSSCGEGGCAVVTTKRLEGIHDDFRSSYAEDSSPGGHSTSRGSSPARPTINLETSAYTCSTPTLLRQAQGLIKGSETRSSSNLSTSCKKKSPLTSRRSTGTCELSPPPPGASPGSNSSTTPQQSRSNRLSLYQDDHYTPTSLDDGDTDAPSSSAVSNGSGEGVESLVQKIEGLDDVDAGLHDAPKAKDALEHIQIKIKRTRDLIKEEQKSRDENVNEYLKLASNADRQQLSRIKAVFEKKNQKSSINIKSLQTKMEGYQKKQKEIELHGLNGGHHHRPPSAVLRDMGIGLKRSVVLKPKEIANRLKNKFGSADNIKELVYEEEKEEEKAHHGSATLPPGASLHPPTSTTPQASHQMPPVTASSGGATGSVGGGGGSSGGGGAKYGSEESSECNSSITSESLPGAGGSGSQLAQLASPRNHQGGDLTYWDNAALLELQERREENARLREDIETIKQTMTAEVSLLRELMSEERFKSDRLEEQINDLTELHQNEMENLKTTMTDMEEKVQYQSEERIRDLHEVVENCQTRISRMEHQQAQQQQQFLNLEGLDNGNARALIVKLINILLTVLQVLLLVIATVANILTPLLQTRGRLITTITFFILLVVMYIQLPEIKEYLESWITRFRRPFFAS